MILCYNQIMDELKKYGLNIYVNDYEISILKKCNIDILTYQNVDEILFMIDKFLNEFDLDSEEYEEIDYVANTLLERKYYTGNK